MSVYLTHHKKGKENHTGMAFGGNSNKELKQMHRIKVFSGECFH